MLVQKMAAIAIIMFLVTAASGTHFSFEHEDKAFWRAEGESELTLALSLRQNLGVAKNVIMFLGDGMGISTITAARIYKGQLEGKPGEGHLLNFEKFPNVALSKTYSADRQTSESASTATACLSGVKVNFGIVGLDARVKRGNCSLVNDTSVYLDTILDWSLAAGKSAGIVTTARVTHATPASAYAHAADRNWESWSPPGCGPDIATQLLKNNANITVIMGGGRKNFVNRTDGVDLIQEWLTTKQSEGKQARYVQNATELRNVNVAETDNLLGLFTESHMSWEMTRNDTNEPSISEMTVKAIEMLKKNDKGFFLLVEGGRIDHAHHDNWAKRALSETVSLDDAVAAAMGITDNEDTLIVVTADHSHPFSISGYPTRGNDILGLVDIIDDGQEPLDGKPYTTLSYANGPGPNRTENLTGANFNADTFQYQRIVPFKAGWETHAGEDVAIYATGPRSYFFHGVHEQNYIATAMGYASCVGPNTDHCTNPQPPVDDCTTGGVTGSRSSLAGLALSLCVIINVLVW